MRLLFTVPHYFAPTATADRRHGATSDEAGFRREAFASSLLALHQQFGSAQCVMQIAQGRTQSANAPLTAEVHVVVCTTGGKHLLDELPVDSALFHHYPTHAEPKLLGFECHRILRDRWGNYDFYAYLEDDLILHDPWLFAKLSWFVRQAGNDAVLLPNRFERGRQPLVHKAYVDGDLAPRVTAKFQDVSVQPRFTGTALGMPVAFHRPLNPHSGCFFLNAEQMAHWSRQRYFLDRDTSFVGPLESAATLGVAKTFRIYKPAPQNASFLEIEHAGSRFLSLLRRPGQ